MQTRHLQTHVIPPERSEILPVDLRWLTDHLSLSIESDVAKTDLFLESINNNIVSLTANVLSTHACMLYSDLFKIDPCSTRAYTDSKGSHIRQAE